MIRTLQRKFVLTAMAAVTVLLLFLLGGINVANGVIVGEQVQRTLEMLASANMEGENPFPPSDPPRDHPFDLLKNDYDTFLSSNFFLVCFNPAGEVTFVDVSRTSSVTEEEAEDLAREVYQGEKSQGTRGSSGISSGTAWMAGPPPPSFWTPPRSGFPTSGWCFSPGWRGWCAGG